MNPPNHTCAICRAPIHLGLLMCRRHWRLVPREQQRAVVAAYGRWQRRDGGPRDMQALIQDYRTARDAAVASAREAEPIATGEMSV